MLTKLNLTVWTPVCAVILAGLGAWFLVQGPRLEPVAGRGVDSAPVGILARVFRGGQWKLEMRGWGRLRGSLPLANATPSNVEVQKALDVLRKQRMHKMFFLRAENQRWAGGHRGLRPSGGIPLDLREGYRWGWSLAQIYGARIEAWEIDNEPDVGFVLENPENYAAFLKAMYIGLHAGAERTLGWRPPSAYWESASSGQWRVSRYPLVVMGPLALPPGPYFDRLVENGFLSYTDGFNYHYYGYAQDFSGVYRMFESALADSNQPPSASASRSVLRKSLPVFLSEYGYSLLSGKAATTTEGRVRQWKFFRDVRPQIEALGIEAPMAFYLQPYREYGAKEYGLTMRHSEPVNPNEGRSAGTHQNFAADILTAGGIAFRPNDFGVAEMEPWMRDIGRKFGEWEVSPALAWLLHRPALPRSSAMQVMSEAPSPVVIDFIAGAAMQQAKSYGGYFLTEKTPAGWTGDGRLRIYNFARSAVEGILRIEGTNDGIREIQLRLRAGEMREITIELTASGFLRATEWRATFVPNLGSGIARFSSRVFADPRDGQETLVEDFSSAGAAVRANAHFLDTRPRASEEESLQTMGRWRVSKGLSVTEDNGVWRFTVTGFPDESTRPAVAELPLRDGLRFSPESLLRMDLRLVPRTIDQVHPTEQPLSHPNFSRLDREPIWPHVRTRTGNLYMMAIDFPIQTQWRLFAEMPANFTPAFYGRMELPWRFLDHEPAALVFHFRPRLLPAVYEVRNARVVELTSGDPLQPTGSR